MDSPKSRKSNLKKKTKSQKTMVCLCNSVYEQKVIEAIQSGARSLDQIFDLSNAGVGPCGGSCRPQLQIILDRELKKLSTNSEE